MKKTTALLLGTAAILATASVAIAGPSTITHKTAHRFISGNPPGSATLYDQNGNDGGTGVSSQNFESSFDAYDDQGADDFVVPSGHTWTVKEVDITGVYYNGYGPAASETVYFYKNKGGLPGKLAAECDGVAGSDNGSGSFTIKIPKSCKVKLKAGTYWVSVQANMDFLSGGQWGWEVNSVQNGNASAWQNPGGGFGVCPTWGTTLSCIGYGPDYMFALKGKDKS